MDINNNSTSENSEGIYIETIILKNTYFVTNKLKVEIQTLRAVLVRSQMEMRNMLLET